jgi:phosphinothricin acetyltransferase
MNPVHGFVKNIESVEHGWSQGCLSGFCFAFLGNLIYMELGRQDKSTPLIRLAEEGDAPQIAAIYAPVVRDTIISFEAEPPSAEEIARRVRDTLVRWPWLVCERDGEVLGYAYAGAHRSRVAYQWSVDVSVYVRDDARQRGVGRALYTSLIAALDLQGFYNAYAGIALPNNASVGLHEAMGFRLVGVYRGVGYKLGAWRDVGWWGLALHEGTASEARPNTPIAIPMAKEADGWNAALERGLRLLQSGA